MLYVQTSITLRKDDENFKVLHLKSLYEIIHVSQKATRSLRSVCLISLRISRGKYILRDVRQRRLKFPASGTNLKIHSPRNNHAKICMELSGSCINR